MFFFGVCFLVVGILLHAFSSRNSYFPFKTNRQLRNFSDTEQQFVQQIKRDSTSSASVETENQVIATPQPKIEILFVGDMMFDRHIRQKASQAEGYGFIFENVQKKFATADLVVGNLEGPVTDFDSKSVGSAVGSTNNYIFTFSPEITPVLFENNIKVVNLGNNHILNFGQEGLQQTYHHLDEGKIEYFGRVDSQLLDHRDEMLLKELDGVKFLFVNYNQFVSTDIETLLVSIEQLRPEVDIIVLYTHWGNEYVTQANSTIQNLAYRFIDSGVDVIIGSHPHVVQQSELYKNKMIYYSLGNFIFDQYFSEEVRTGKIVTMSVDPQTLEMQFDEMSTFLEMDGSVSVKSEKNNDK